jgi:hypothetical protein
LFEKETAIRWVLDEITEQARMAREEEKFYAFSVA